MVAYVVFMVAYVVFMVAYVVFRRFVENIDGYSVWRVVRKRSGPREEVIGPREEVIGPGGSA